jgi:hypothetical protein
MAPTAVHGRACLGRGVDELVRLVMLALLSEIDVEVIIGVPRG